MDFIKLCLCSVGSVVVLFFLCKLIGNKQISELSMYDYITGISIGSIAAEMATELEEPWKPLTAMVIYALFTLGFSVLCSKSVGFRRFGYGKTLVLFRNGRLDRENLKKAKLDLNELITRCRSAGYFDLRELSAILLEPNGKTSFLPFSSRRPATPADLTITPPDAAVMYDIIIDGKVCKRNLRATGRDEGWLNKKLKELGQESEKDVFLGLTDGTELVIYEKNVPIHKEDRFE